MRYRYKVFLTVIAVGYAMVAGSVSLSAENAVGFFPSVKGKRFVITGVSTGDILVFNDVFIFSDDGSFIMKKMETYGEGEYFEFVNGLFYFIFNNHGGVDIQFAEGIGFSLPSPLGQTLFGVGGFMIDYGMVPMVFSGIEVFQN